MADVAARELDRDCAARLEARWPGVRASACARLRGYEAQGLELLREHLGDGVVQTAEHDRGGAAMKPQGHFRSGLLALQCAKRRQRVDSMLAPVRGQASETLLRGRSVGRFGAWQRRKRPRARKHVEVHGSPELREHVRDGRDADHRVHSVAPAVGVGACEASIEVDRASAHACDAPRPVEQGMGRADQDQVLIRAEVVEDIDDFDVEALGSRAPKYRETIALHSWANLVDVNETRCRLGNGGAEERRAHYETQAGEQPLHAEEA